MNYDLIIHNGRGTAQGQKMTMDAIYLGIFAGMLAALFGLAMIMARFQRDRKFFLINLVIAGVACFFILDKRWLSGIVGMPELKIWLAAGVSPLLVAALSQSHLVRHVTDMKEDAPRVDKFLRSILIGQAVLALAFAAPVALELGGMRALSGFVEGWLVPVGFVVAAGISCIGWMLALLLTPGHIGEWRWATVLSSFLFSVFLIAYTLITLQIVSLGPSLTAGMRLSVLASIACMMLAVFRRAEFVEVQRSRVDAARRERDADWEHRQHSRQAINQAHLMQVLRREKELEAELRKREAEQMEALKAAKEAADETARNKAQFLAFMSHEIRTPLNGIMGMVRLLMSTNINDQQRDYIQTLNYSGDALLSLVNDTLDISKIEAGQLVLESIDFDLQRLVDSIIMLMSARASEKNLKLRGDVGPLVPRNINGDPTRLRQILLNLINNAIKFTETGGVTVSVRRLASAPDGVERLRFEVQDTGPGISEEGCSRLFKQYSQVDASTTRVHGGTGLGLSICKQLVQAMQGDIGVDSVVGKGSSFWFVLDYQPATGESEPEIVHPPKGPPVLSAMVVEDNEIHQKVIGGYLRLDGHEVVMVGSAEDALAAFDRKHFDVLLMDVNLPNMNGNDATRAIRRHADPVKASVPIIAITGNTSPMDIDECRNAGMDDFVGKPVDPDALRKTIYATNAKWLLKSENHQAPQVTGQAMLRIMVVDDNQINQKVIGGFLQAGGHELVIVANGEDAVALAADGSFDLILMDVTLPGIDGLEATRRIRNLPSREARAVTIIAITGNTGREDVEACRQAGMDDFIGKPVDPDALERIVHRIPRRTPPAQTSIPAPAPPLSLDDYLPIDGNGVQLLDNAVLSRLMKAFDRKTLLGLIDDMLAESQPLIDGMSAIAVQADWQEVRAKAHALKGMAMTLGVIGVGEVAADIESSVQRGETPAALETMLQQLQSVFDQSGQALDQWRAENFPAVA